MKRGITLRSIILGFFLAVAHTCWIVYEETALGHFGVSFTTYMLIQSVLALLFLLLILNSILKRIIPSIMLSPAELMIIFIMTSISAAISGFDLLQNLFPVLLWPRYFGTPADGFDRFLPYTPKFFIPQNDAVIKAFFTGTHNFWGFFEPTIFKAWIVPMLFWGGMLFVLASTMMCLNSVFRRQWLDKEKLSFPVIELPLTMAKEATAGPFIKNPLFLIGFGITVLLLSMNSLAGMYPAVPGLRLNVVNVGRTMFATPPLSGMNPIYVAWWPYAIGLCYLIPLETSFSCWFFYVFIRLAMAFGTAQGWREPNAGFSPDQFPHFQYLTYGAWIGMFFVVMWSVKGHLIQIFRKAFTNEDTLDDSNESMSYRTAVIGATVGFTILLTAAIVSGIQPHIALFFFSIFFLLTIVMTRIYAQVSVPLLELAMLSTTPLMTSFTGTSALTRQDATILTNFYWFNRTYRQHPMGHGLESIVMADKLGQKTRSIVWIVMLSVVIGIVVGMLTTLQIYYARGGASAQVLGSQMGVGWEAWNMIPGKTSGVHPPQLSVIVTILISIGIVLALAYARNLWFAFPLHPVGYVLAVSYTMEYVWAVVLVTWLIKTLVVRYGGLKLYRKTLPLFYGIILGDAVAQVLWGIALSALGAHSASPYLDMKW